MTDTYQKAVREALEKLWLRGEMTREQFLAFAAAVAFDVADGS